MLSNDHFLGCKGRIRLVYRSFLDFTNFNDFFLKIKIIKFVTKLSLLLTSKSLTGFLAITVVEWVQGCLAKRKLYDCARGARIT